MAAIDRSPVSREFSDCERGRILETWLEPTLLCRFENWFQQELSSLRIFFFRNETETSVFGPKAFSIGTHVFLDDAIASATIAHAQYLLAHEIAHVVQRIRARVSG